MATVYPTYSLSNNKALSLGQELGSGGEARIFAIGGDAGRVVKIYHKPDAEHTAKLQSMLAKPPLDPTRHQGHISIAWPIELVYDKARNCAGFVMPRIDFATSARVLELYNPAGRMRKAPNFTWRYLLRTARNLASVVEAVHSAGYVVGDLNESNLLVSNNALVTLVDCDSMQVPGPGGKLFRCNVGKPEYTPPELQGVDFSTVDRNTHHDDFGLAVLIFMLLMEGRHPFTGIWVGNGSPRTIEEYIKDGSSPYVGAVTIQVAPNAVPFDTLPPEVQMLVIRCFGAGHRNPQARPSAGEWLHVLSQVEGQLQTCTRNQNHVYSKHLGNHCPWCERMNKLGVPDPFPPTGAQQPLPPRQFTTPLPAVRMTTPAATTGTQPVQGRTAPAQGANPKARRSNMMGRFVMLILLAVGAVWAGPSLLRSGLGGLGAHPTATATYVSPPGNGTSGGNAGPTDTPDNGQTGPGSNSTDSPNGGQTDGGNSGSGGAAPTTERDDGVISLDVNLRAGPSADMGSLQIVKQGAHLQLLARDGQDAARQWVKVKVLIEGRPVGWVLGKYISATLDMASLPVEYVQVPPTATSPRIGALSGLGRIAFASNRGNTQESDIYVMNADGSAPQPVTQGEGYNLFPDWSPDNSRIVYMLGANPGCATDPPAGDIYVVNADGSNRQRLTNGRCARSPRWSPDGSEIVFNDATGADLSLYDIYVMDANGSNIHQLTNTPGFDGYPTWMRDGRILFVSERAGGSQVYVMKDDGSGQRVITVAPGEKRQPAASPDGTRFAFAFQYKGAWDIWVMAANGAWTKKITDGRGRNLYPSWSPDSQWLAFHSNRDDTNNYDVYAVPAGGGDIQRLTYDGDYDDEPAWSK